MVMPVPRLVIIKWSLRLTPLVDLESEHIGYGESASACMLSLCVGHCLKYLCSILRSVNPVHTKLK